LILLACTACAPSTEPPTAAPQADAGMLAEHERMAFGGRLFDMWYDDIDTGFVPDDAETPAIDGSGGPNGNGTLNGADGRPLANNGHDYRLKNLLGWDMRGVAGIYGDAYQAKEFIVATGPLSPEHAYATREFWIERLTNGGGGLPAYRDVLDADQIAALVDYMLEIRDGQLPHPDTLYSLSTASPNGFVLASGGEVARGRAFYDAQCADCHGADGTKIMFDNGEQTLGQHARYYGYAVAMITVAGEPGSDMGPQLPPGLSAAEQSGLLLDLMAALCDRERYPATGATDPEVPDNDVRCGAYLR
jgi:mono/diheme cytochrome c family protein